MLPPIEMFLHWTELEPVKLVSLGWNINLVQNILLASSPEDLLENRQNWTIVSVTVGFIHSQLPPGLYQVGVQLEEQEQAVHVIDRLPNRGTWMETILILIFRYFPQNYLVKKMSFPQKYLLDQN